MKVNKNILIIKGGYSEEAEVSRNTAVNVEKALKLKGYRTKSLEVDKNFFHWLLNNRKDVDVVFNALHGFWGEDGKVQGLLECLKIPYTHSGVSASAIGMNKYLSKNIFMTHGMNVPKGYIINKNKITKKEPLERPFIIKPVSEGSSLGIHLIKKKDSLKKIISKLKINNFLIEEFIPGNDITVAVINGKPLGILEVLIKQDIYSYDAKYKSKNTKYVIPNNLSEKTIKNILSVSEKSFKLLNCRGVARIDFRINKNSKKEDFFILEINTQPGLTKNSLLPRIAKNSGIEFPDLVELIINDAGLKK